MDILNPRFEAIDSKFDAMNYKFSIITWSVWSLPIFMTVMLAVFTLLIKKII